MSMSASNTSLDGGPNVGTRSDAIDSMHSSQLFGMANDIFDLEYELAAGADDIFRSMSFWLSCLFQSLRYFR